MTYLTSFVGGSATDLKLGSESKGKLFDAAAKAGAENNFHKKVLRLFNGLYP
jgi:hypothetical protein